MKKLVLFVLILSLSLFFGCSDNNETTDEANIEELITVMYAYFDAVDYSGEDTVESDIKEAIEPAGWYRELNDTQDGWQYEFEWHGGDTAYVNFERPAAGILHIFTTDSLEYNKDFEDTFYRYAIFVKDTVAEYHGGWRLFALSPAEVHSDNNTMSIDSVVVSWTDGRLVIDDINKPIHRDEIPVIYSGDTIKVTVYATPNSLVFLHSFRHRWFMPESEEGVSGVYERFYIAPLPGIYRVGIDMMSRETLLDDSAQYMSYGWVFPYIVEEGE